MARSKSQATKKPQPVLQPRIRARIGSEIAIGPGKAELLELIRETGSIQESARRMRMSYMRAWKLLRTMNDCFHEPLVVAERGGKGGGGARLTATGHKVLTLYRRMEAQSLRATEKTWATFRTLLR